MEYKVIYLAKRNPTVSLEDWPRTWRSHAVFASQFPAMGAEFSFLGYCNRMLEPTLEGAPFQPPGASTEYDGVAVVSSPVKSGLRPYLSEENQAKIDQDELRVFRELTPNFTFRCKEALVHGGAPGGAAVIRFLVRKSELAAETFFERWNETHAEIAVNAANTSGTVVRYVHDRMVEDPPPGYPFDGIVETWFATPEDAVKSFVDDAFAPVRDDLQEFCDLDQSVTMLTHVIHRWPREPKGA